MVPTWLDTVMSATIGAAGCVVAYWYWPRVREWLAMMWRRWGPHGNL